MINFRLLTKDDIECKVKKVTENGCILLLYKTARTDMDILDEAVGPENWTCTYREVKGNLYCAIGIRVAREPGDFGDPWVFKEDCGIESREDEGNEKKGEASDAFKRAGFKWGIGRELYTAPFIFIPAEKCNIKGEGGRYKTFDTFSVEGIAYEDGKISGLAITNEKTNRRCFMWMRPKDDADR